MDRFELFTLIYYALHTYYHNTPKSENLLELISDLNPFIWADRSSADPAYFYNFCEVIKQEEISVEESYALARSYLETLDLYKDEALEAFDAMPEERWKKGVKEYLSAPHK